MSGNAAFEGVAEGEAMKRIHEKLVLLCLLQRKIKVVLFGREKTEEKTTIFLREQEEEKLN